MLTPDSIRWGIIGCGSVTEVKSGPAFSKVPFSSLLAVMRRDGNKAADYAKRHSVPKWYTDANTLINDSDINAIYIATPPGSHEEYAIAALRAGKPVYVEKPMSISKASCIRMLYAANETGTKLSVAHYRRALSKFLHIKQVIDDKKIGDVRMVRISLLQPHKPSIDTQNNWRIDPAIAGAGLFYDLAPHQLDLVQYFFGLPTDIFGNSAQQAGLYAAEDAVTGIMRLPGNILFTGQWCYTVAEQAREDIFEIIGSKGSMVFAVFDHHLKIISASGEENISFQPPQHIQQPMIEKVVRYFLGNGNNPSPADDAIHSMHVMESFAYGNS